MRPRRSWLPLLLIPIGLYALWLSNDRFLLAGGSDAPVTIWAPSVAAQSAAGFVFAIMIGIARRRPLFYPLAAILLGLAAHRVVRDTRAMEVRDQISFLTINAAPLDPEALNKPSTAPFRFHLGPLSTIDFPAPFDLRPK
jgi:hypothetical protein